VIVCTRCGFENEDTDAFCGSCAGFLEWEGQKVSEEAQPEPEPEPEPEPQPEEHQGFIDRVKEKIGIGDDRADGSTAAEAAGAASVAAGATSVAAGTESGAGDQAPDTVEAPAPPPTLGAVSAPVAAGTGTPPSTEDEVEAPPKAAEETTAETAETAEAAEVPAGADGDAGQAAAADDGEPSLSEPPASSAAPT
jgi:hypothetical protein